MSPSPHSMSHPTIQFRCPTCSLACPCLFLRHTRQCHRDCCSARQLPSCCPLAVALARVSVTRARSTHSHVLRNTADTTRWLRGGTTQDDDDVETSDRAAKHVLSVMTQSPNRTPRASGGSACTQTTPTTNSRCLSTNTRCANKYQALNNENLFGWSAHPSLFSFVSLLCWCIFHCLHSASYVAECATSHDVL